MHSEFWIIWNFELLVISAQVCHEVVSRCGLGCSHLMAWLGLGNLHPWWLTHMVSKLVPLHISITMGLLSILISWKLAFLRISNPRGQGWICYAFMTLEVTHLCLYHILLSHRSILIQWGRWTQKGMNTRRWSSVETILEVGIPYSIFKFTHLFFWSLHSSVSSLNDFFWKISDSLLVHF